LKIIFHLDVPFGKQFIPVIQVAKSYLGCWLGVGPSVHDIPDDDIIGRNADVDGPGFFLAEFVVFDGIFDEGLQGDGRNEEILSGELPQYQQQCIVPRCAQHQEDRSEEGADPAEASVQVS